MKDFAAIPFSIVFYIVGLFAGFHFSTWAFSDFEYSQLITISSMGIIAAITVKLFIRLKFQGSYFGSISLLFIGIILGVSAIFSFVRDLNLMSCGLPYFDTFAILSAVALILGGR